MKTKLIYLTIIILLLFVVSGCRSGMTRIKEQKKTDLTIPAGSVFTFEKGVVAIPRDVPVSIVENNSKVSPPDPVEMAKGKFTEKMYWVGGGLFLLAAFFFWRAHVKAGVVCLVGAVFAPVVAKFYSSDIAQYIAFAAMVIGCTLFFAWQMVKKRIPLRDEIEQG